MCMYGSHPFEKKIEIKSVYVYIPVRVYEKNLYKNV